MPEKTDRCTPEALEEIYKSKKDPYGIKSKAHKQRLGEIGCFLHSGLDEGKLLPLYERMLDVGCGEGFSTSWLAELADVSVGIDVSGTAIKRAVHSYNRRENLEFAEADVLEYKPRRKFDLIVATAVVDCFTGIRAASTGRWGDFTDAVKRCLRKRGGRLLVSHVKTASDGDGYLGRLEDSGFRAVRSAEFECGGSVHSIHLLKQI